MQGAVLVPSEHSSVLWLGPHLARNYTGLNNLQKWPDPSSGSAVPGTSTNPDGTFASPPVVIQIGADQLVSGVGTDYAIRLNRSIVSWTTMAGLLSGKFSGGDLTSTPGVTSTSADGSTSSHPEPVTATLPYGWLVTVGSRGPGRCPQTTAKDPRYMATVNHGSITSEKAYLAHFSASIVTLPSARTAY
jgi:hypothetical protein